MMIQISKESPSLAKNTKIYQNNVPPSAVESFLISIFDLTQTCGKELKKTIKYTLKSYFCQRHMLF